MTGMARWQKMFDEKALGLYPSSDPSHDHLHIRRVVAMAMRLAKEESADENVVLPAAYFHDFVNVPKNDPRRSQASRLSGDAAVEYLASVGYPAQYFDAIRHAIAAHSFSANIKPETIEAMVVQDADRLDALGAIGAARVFSISALMQTAYYNPDDPWAEKRALDDKTAAIDHFPIKLFKIADTMNTRTAREEAARRVVFMRDFLRQMGREIGASGA